MRQFLGRILFRILLVNLIVLLVPVAGLEFARIYERQLLNGLQRDMVDQTVLVREMAEEGLHRGVPLSARRHLDIIVGAARQTRTRIRLLDRNGQVRNDSHGEGAPEGPEPPAPTILPARLHLRELSSRLPRRAREASSSYRGNRIRSIWSRQDRVQWPQVEARREVLSALRGQPDAQTRMRDRNPGVFLFIAEPIRFDGEVWGAVYATRSTQPVLEELYKIRTGLIRVLALAGALTLLMTFMLAWSISRPLTRLSRAARQIAAGGKDIQIPVAGSGEIRDLAQAFATMTERLDARVRYISDFSADMAHEFKSPLTSIRGAAELLVSGADDDPEARTRFLRNIELDAERLDRLVSRLLELSRIEASDAPALPFDLGAMITRVKDRVEPHSGTGGMEDAEVRPPTPLVVEWATDELKWIGRENDIERALLNLVENAQHFSPPDTHVLLRIERDGKELRLHVCDRGPGVPQSQEHRVFDRFFTTDADRQGTGLGLAIVKTVAEIHQGSVTLQRRPGGGSIFTLTLIAPSSI